MAADSDFDWDALAAMLEQLADQWNSLSDEEKSQMLSVLDSTDGELKPGTEDKSEFQRSAGWFTAASVVLGLAAASATMGVVTAPVGVALGICAGIYKLMGTLGNQMTPERTVKLSAWLSERAPRFMATACENPALIFGLSYTLNPEGPWYLLSTCPWATEEDSMLTLGKVTPPTSITVGDVPWDTSQPSSSSGPGKGALILGALGLAAWALS